MPSDDHDDHDLGRFIEIFDLTDTILFRVDAEGRLFALTPAFERLTGWSAAEAESFPPFHNVHPDDLERVRDVFGRLLTGERTARVMYRYLTKWGHYGWYVSEVVPGNAQGTFVGVTRDFTEERETLRALERSEARFRTLAQQAALGIFTLDAGGNLLFANEGMPSISGYAFDDEEAWRGGLLSELVHPSDLPRVLAEYEQRWADGLPVHLEFRLLAKGGEQRWVRLFGRTVDVEGERLFHGIIEDVTNELEASTRFREERERLHLFLEYLPGIAYRATSAFRFTFVAGDVEAITGHDEGDFLRGAVTLDDLVHEEDVDEFSAARDALLSADSGESLEHTFRIVRPDGSIRWVTERCRLLPAKTLANATSHPTVLGIIHDVTQRKLAEQEVARTTKLDSIALLAGGIAHDFNNYLVGILGNLELLKASPNLSTSDRESLKSLEGATLRASELARQLLTFSRGGAPLKRTTDLVAVVRDVVGFLSRGVPCQGRVEVVHPVPRVVLDPVQIAQVLQNLIVNAIQATQAAQEAQATAADGEPEVVVRVQVCPRGAVAQASFAGDSGPVDFVRVDVVDHGVGIPEEAKEHIFEPYFTTKPNGTGLGLATAYSIVKRHGGRLFFAPTPGGGTTFSFVLPLVEGTTEPTGGDGTEFFGAGRRALVMDDDPSVRSVLRRMLGVLSFVVDSVSDGEGALEAAKNAAEDGSPYHLLVLDLNVPGALGGGDVAKSISRILPDARLIVTSGYYDGEVMSNHETHGFHGALPKPFTMDQLKRALFEAFRGEVTSGRPRK
ncbi:MAG: hypothetical protein Kow0069_31580 [Promethearchaeota archaeon]